MATHYDYLLIGGGMAAAAAARGIRETAGSGSVALLSRENDRPYNRPPLSKALWRGEPVASIWRDADLAGVGLLSGRDAVWLDPAGHRVRDDRGDEYGYGKLLLATGGTPRKPPFASERLIAFRTFADYERLRALAPSGARAVVVGGGFIGSEIAAALASNGVSVTLVFPEDGVCARALPKELSAHVTERYRAQGVRVLAGNMVTGLQDAGSKCTVRTRGGEVVDAEAVVVGIGIEPETALAQKAGLLVADGILVDATLRTSHADIYAAGDVASFPDPVLGRQRRVEHEDNANAMGLLAGQAMAGQPAPYDHQPFFYSDLFDMGYEAVGDVDTRLETVIDWQQPFAEGVVYFLREARVRGVLLWNRFGHVDAARELIAEPGPVEPAGLRGRI